MAGRIFARYKWRLLLLMFWSTKIQRNHLRINDNHRRNCMLRVLVCHNQLNGINQIVEDVIQTKWRRINEIIHDNMRPRERVFDFHIMNNSFLIYFCTIFLFKIWVNGKHNFSTALAISTKAGFKGPLTI